MVTNTSWKCQKKNRCLCPQVPGKHHFKHIFCGEFGHQVIQFWIIGNIRKLTTVSAESHWNLAPPHAFASMFKYLKPTDWLVIQYKTMFFGVQFSGSSSRSGPRDRCQETRVNRCFPSALVVHIQALQLAAEKMSQSGVVTAILGHFLQLV